MLEESRLELRRLQERRTEEDGRRMEELIEHMQDPDMRPSSETFLRLTTKVYR